VKKSVNEKKKREKGKGEPSETENSCVSKKKRERLLVERGATTAGIRKLLVFWGRA